MVEIKKTLTFVPQTGEKAYYYMPYKEPLMVLENGFGYPGVLLINDFDKVQCHVCGNWFDHLGAHVKKHGYTPTTYKQEFGFLKGTALINERIRLLQIEAHNKYPKERYTKGLEAMHSASCQRKIDHSGKGARKTAEYKNKHGLCRAQLLFRLKVLEQKLGVLSQPKIQTIDKAIIPMLKKEFGSYDNALTLASVIKTKHLKSMSVTPELLIADIKMFKEQNKRLPTLSDFRRGLLVCSEALARKYFGSMQGCAKAAGFEPRIPDYIACNIPKLECIQLYSQGYTGDMLAKRYNCQRGVIYDFLHKNGIKIWGPWKRPHGSFSDMERDVHAL